MDNTTAPEVSVDGMRKIMAMPFQRIAFNSRMNHHHALSRFLFLSGECVLDFEKVVASDSPTENNESKVYYITIIIYAKDDE
jgi:hypothetical protein